MIILKLNHQPSYLLSTCNMRVHIIVIFFFFLMTCRFDPTLKECLAMLMIFIVTDKGPACMYVCIYNV